MSRDRKSSLDLAELMGAYKQDTRVNLRSVELLQLNQSWKAAKNLITCRAGCPSLVLVLPKCVTADLTQAQTQAASPSPPSQLNSSTKLTFRHEAPAPKQTSR